MAGKKKEEELVEEVVETYPNMEFPAILLTALDQMRQSIILGSPLAIEWLGASLAAGRLLDVADFHEHYRETRDAERAIQDAVGHDTVVDLTAGEVAS
jgi:hypothetical protein